MGCSARWSRSPACTRFGPPAGLVLYASLIIVVLGERLGVVSGLRPGLLSTGTLVTTAVLAAIPAFVATIVLILLFAVKLRWFPALGNGTDFASNVRHFTLPAIALAAASLAIVARVTRTSVCTATCCTPIPPRSPRPARTSPRRCGRLRAIPGRPLSAFEARAQECAIGQGKEIAGMFQVHLVCRRGESDRLVGLLTTDAGVRNIVVLPASARRPDGDVIQFDLAAGSADPVLRQLRDLDIGERSPVAVHIVDAALPELLPSARRGRRRRLGEIAPVCELLYARIRADAVYAPSFYMLLSSRAAPGRRHGALSGITDSNSLTR